MSDTRLHRIYKELLHFDPNFRDLTDNEKDAFIAKYLPLAETSVRMEESIDTITGFVPPPNYYNYEYQVS